MPKKLDERHQKWLISDEEREFETFVAEALGQWSDSKQKFLELAAMRLDFSAGSDYDLTAFGSPADKAVRELKALFGSQGTIFNNAINKPDDLSSGKPLSRLPAKQQASNPYLPA